MKKEEKIKVGISIGDLNGIGIEIILKTFADSRMLDFCTPILFGSSKVISFHKKALDIATPIHGITSLDKVLEHKVNLFSVWKDDVTINLGETNKSLGEYAFLSLDSAVKALNDNAIDVLVTAPINKDNIQSDKFKFQGHTEFLEANIPGKSLMILMADELRVGLITGHVPIQDVSKLITPKLIKEKVAIMHQSLIQDFKIRKPKIALLGLNPHCGDNGVIGDEDNDIIKPTILELREKGQLIYGPYAADSFFGSSAYKDFDGVLAMYHDQGLAPFKTLSFGKGVNFTAGLEKIRTSPDHGTAFEIAGKNEANESSFKEALFQAISIFENRKEFFELTENVLKKRRPSRQIDKK